MIKGYMTPDALVLLFLFFALTIAIIIKQLQKVFTFVPYTPTLFVISILLGKYSDSLGVVGQSIQSTSEIDPRGILLIFLPPLIFESSFNSDWYVFRKQAVQILILAFPSVVVSATVVMLSLKLIIGYDQTYYTYVQAFMFGSILSCTDTVAVLALLKQAGAPKKFSSLIEGESLLNDGACMILFTICLELCKGGTMGLGQIGLLFIQLTGGAVVLGVLFGIVATELIKLFKNDSLLCYNTTLVGCYLLYFTAEYVHLGIHVSGIMALVSMGLYMAAFGRTKFSAQARENVHHIWKVFVFIAETVIFILGGVIVGIKSLHNPVLIDLIGAREIKGLFLLFICMIFSRFIGIGVFMPKLKNLGYGLRWNQVVALTYGGLRGAVGIAFTLILAANDFLPQKFRSICIFNMAGCAFLTLVINAPTCSTVIIKLGLCVKSETKVRLFNKFMQLLSNQLDDKVQQLRSNKYLQNANWEKVTDQAGIAQLRSHIDLKIEGNQALIMADLNRNLLSQHYDDVIDPNVMIEIRSRFGIALKGIFWRKFQNNECSDLAIRKLTECVDLDLDSTDQPLNSWEYLISEQQSMIFFPIVFWLRQFPLINKYALAQVYYRISSIYELVSTYIQGLNECEIQYMKFPFERNVLNELNEQASKNRKLAQAYLDYQIKISYPQIMKRVQTSKICQSLLNFQIQELQLDHKQGRIDQQFYFQLKVQIESNINRLQNGEVVSEQLSELQALKKHEFFKEISDQEFKLLREEQIEKLMQKDEPLVRSYQKLRYLYFVARGEVHEQWKLPNHTFHKQTVSLFEFVGLSELYTGSNSAEIEYTATATSVACLYGFPLQRIKDLSTNNSKLQGILYKQMLPLIAQLHKEINLGKMSYDFWSKIKPNVEFYRLLRGETQTIIRPHVLLIEGRISINGKESGPGYYRIHSSQVVNVLGSAKFYLNEEGFVYSEQRDSYRRLSSTGRIRNEQPILDMSQVATT